ncbi:MAG: sigma-70 family RNA polymerase sigma factor [Pseudomonadota bacterium]
MSASPPSVRKLAAQPPATDVEDSAVPTQGGNLPSAQNQRLAQLYAECAEELTVGIQGRFGSGPPDPDDVIQDAFQRVAELGDITHIRNLKAFVWRTARNLVLDAKKTLSIRSKYDFEIEQLYFSLKGENLSPEIVIRAREQLAVINQAIMAMPERRRRALLLYRLDGRTLAQIGKELSISITAVRKHIAKAHAELNLLFVD